MPMMRAIPYPKHKMVLVAKAKVKQGRQTRTEPKSNQKFHQTKAVALPKTPSNVV